MINSISNVSFRAGSAQDLINLPGNFTTVPAAAAEMPYDTFGEEKKSHIGRNVLLTLSACLGAFVGLGYAVKSGKLAKIEKADMPEGFFKKAWAHVKNFGATIGEYGEKCINKVSGWFGKKGEKAADAAENAAK